MASNPLSHAFAAMGGRDPQEKGRVATPLELFFDLTFAISFGVAAAQFAAALAEGHVGAGLLGFGFAMFAVVWAWINFSWFASAYDTDDWIFRLVTMVQMVGVLILAMGLEPMFASIAAGEHVDNRVMVLGYVVMRLALVFQWLRAAKQDPLRRATCLKYATYLAIVQLGWIVVLFVETSVPVMFLMAAPLFALEMCIPGLAERTTKTPWHAHHIAERYSLLVIIALGECLLGTIEALRALVAVSGWTVETAVVGLAGTGLAFALWWLYFILPAGHALQGNRNVSFIFGYAHMLVFTSIAATGAGLHVVAYHLEGHAALGEAGVVAAVAIPVAVFALTLMALYAIMVEVDSLHLWMAGVFVAATAGAVLLAAAQAPVGLCLVLIAAAPAGMIIADEKRGHRRRKAALERIAGTGAAGETAS